MHIWKIKPVVLKLKENSLEPSSVKNYYIAMSLLLLFCSYLAMFETPKYFAPLAVEVVACTIITVLGINAAFAANGGNSGERFMDKIVTISFPLIIKFSVSAIVIASPIAAFIGYKQVTELNFEWFMTMVILVTTIAFYMRLRTHIKATIST